MNGQRTATIFNILRFCTSDGEGIRTVVFFKGCPLHCKWCHNPEGLSERPQLSFDVSKCINCKRCADNCVANCHSFIEKHDIFFSRCTACGKCVEYCPTKALTVIGRRMTVNDILTVVKRDLPYYGEKGGVTLSGGELLLQADFVLDLIKAVKEKNINVMIETSGCIHTDAVTEIFSLCDAVLLDYKLSNEKKQTEYTGLNYVEYLRNLKYLQKNGIRTVLRCPLIKGVNNDKKHAESIAELSNDYSCIDEINVLPYHILGKAKAQRMGVKFHEFKILNKKEVESFADEVSKRTDKKVKILY